MGESVNGRDGTWVSGAGTWDLKPRTQNLGPRSDYDDHDEHKHEHEVRCPIHHKGIEGTKHVEG